MSRSLRVMQLLPALHAGGVEQSTLEISEALVRAGHESWVVSAGGRLVEGLVKQGGRHVAHAIGRKSLGTLRHVLTMRRLFRTIRPDIVHARSRLPAWLAWLALQTLPRGHRPHFITTVHGLNSPSWYSAIMARGERVICVSETVRAHVRRHYPWVSDARISVIQRGIDPECFAFGWKPTKAWRDALLHDFPQLRGAKLITLPGRGTRLKGHTHAMHLLTAVRARGIDARLLLLGADERGRDHYVAELRALARTLQVDEYIAITPPRHDARDVMAISDLVLQLSIKPEAFGRTVIEALSLGVPTVGFDHGGVGELLRAHFPTGAVCLGDDQALADRCLDILLRPPLMQPAHVPTLAHMQAATLRLYRETSGAPL